MPATSASSETLTQVIRVSAPAGLPGWLVAQFGGGHDDVAGERIELATGESLGQRDRLGRVLDQTGPADVAAHDAHDPVAELLAVDDQLVPIAQQLVDLPVERPQPDVPVVGLVRAVLVREIELLVVVQV